MTRPHQYGSTQLNFLFRPFGTRLRQSHSLARQLAVVPKIRMGLLVLHFHISLLIVIPVTTAVEILHKYIPKTFSLLPETVPIKREGMFEVFWGFGSGTELLKGRGGSLRRDSVLIILASSQNIR